MFSCRKYSLYLHKQRGCCHRFEVLRSRRKSSGSRVKLMCFCGFEVNILGCVLSFPFKFASHLCLCLSYSAVHAMKIVGIIQQLQILHVSPQCSSVLVNKVKVKCTLWSTNPHYTAATHVLPPIWTTEVCSPSLVQLTESNSNQAIILKDLMTSWHPDWTFQAVVDTKILDSISRFWPRNKSNAGSLEWPI